LLRQHSRKINLWLPEKFNIHFSSYALLILRLPVGIMGSTMFKLHLEKKILGLIVEFQA